MYASGHNTDDNEKCDLKSTRKSLGRERMKAARPQGDEGEIKRRVMQQSPDPCSSDADTRAWNNKFRNRKYALNTPPKLKSCKQTYLLVKT